jgi:hypothetical protein
MENFTAIYSTETYKDINYAFQAKDMECAIEYCKWKFSVTVKIVCENEDARKYESYSTVEELRKHLEIKEVQVNQENKVGIMAYISQKGNVAQWCNQAVFLELFGFHLTELFFIPSTYVAISNRTVLTKKEAFANAKSELSAYFKDLEYNNYKVNEIPSGICEATGFLPAIQLIDKGTNGVNTTWRYTNEN